jgi:hypothetical protein
MYPDPTPSSIEWLVYLQQQQKLVTGTQFIPYLFNYAGCTAAIILGGGAGSRLFPLTKTRAKPAVPIGGAYRLIDVPMSNCINSGISKIYILTQARGTFVLPSSSWRRCTECSLFGG